MTASVPAVIFLSESGTGSLDLDCAVHAWLIPIGYSWALVELGEPWLDAHERDQARRFRFDRDRLLYLESHIWLRRLLSRATDVPPDRLRFRRAEGEKPSLEADHPALAGIDFNLSHTHSCVAIAMSRATRVGVDVERIRSLDAFRDVGGAVLHAQERDWLAALPVPERTEVFFRLWTAKEAHTKMSGRGLRCPFDRLSVTLPDQTSCLVCDETLAPPVSMHHRSFALSIGGSGEYALSVAALDDAVPLVVSRERWEVLSPSPTGRGDPIST